MVRLLVAVVAVLVLVAGCGKNESPGDAQARFLDDLYNGRLDSAYAALHPAYQRIVSRKRFVACTRATALGKLGSIHIVDVYDDPVEIPGSGSVPAKAVRVRLTSPAGGSTTFVNHEVKVDSHWRWVLNAAAAKAYEAGRCPGG
jgi:hypothetical protein